MTYLKSIVFIIDMFETLCLTCTHTLVMLLHHHDLSDLIFDLQGHIFWIILS